MWFIAYTIADERGNARLHHGKMFTGEAGFEEAMAASAPSSTKVIRGSLSR